MSAGTMVVANESIPIPAFDLNISHLDVSSISMDRLEVDSVQLNESFRSIFNIFICMFVVMILQTGSLFYLVYYTRKKQPDDPCLLRLDD